MSLRLPSEIVVERFLPTVRAMFATELGERGWTQQEIADTLGVTQAAVSGYQHGDIDLEDRFATDPRLEQTVTRIADGFDDGTVDEYEALAELLAVIREFEDRGPICAVHEAEMPALQGLGCDLCVRGADDDVLAEREVLATVRKAIRKLERTPGMADAIPNVGTNVGMALAAPTDTTDVAAVPGRIYEMDGRVEVPANPAFGASEHVARTILVANDVDPDIRGAVNLQTDEQLLAAARKRGLALLEFDADYEDRADHLASRFAATGVPTVLYHRGAFGIEPVTYVLGTSAVDAVETATALVAETREPDD